MKKLITYGVFSMLMLMMPAIILAEQPQQQQAKNYPALIAQNGRAICEENLAQVFAVNDDLKAQIATLKAELETIKKPVPEIK